MTADTLTVPHTWGAPSVWPVTRRVGEWALVKKGSGDYSIYHVPSDPAAPPKSLPGAAYRADEVTGSRASTPHITYRAGLALVKELHAAFPTIPSHERTDLLPLLEWLNARKEGAR
ncbi:hypothetical protein [Agromyces larvae]|uniref:Uncharacterized protein n=1 Tax=Agromyces larvae TaxID=2929802 RepID=A0ABY4C3H7_9MICO|nr:hypothetical protein [Agromyces larvae]UOE45945.1 hypothetical protein MTO99_09450 [Agromyces larvae]